MPNQWPPPRRRPRASSDDRLIKIAAGLIVVASLVAGVHWHRTAKATEALALAQAQQQAAADATRHAEQASNEQAPTGPTRLTISSNQPTLYKCRDASGTVAIQDWPCSTDTQAEWSRPLPSDEREAAEARQRAADTARHEAEVAKYTQMFGDRPAPVVYSAGPQSSGNQSRCDAAKRYRDGVYRQVGNNRTFDLIRQLDDYVYEACKSN